MKKVIICGVLLVAVLFVIGCGTGKAIDFGEDMKGPSEEDVMEMKSYFQCGSVCSELDNKEMFIECVDVCETEFGHDDEMEGPRMEGPREEDTSTDPSQFCDEKTPYYDAKLNECYGDQETCTDSDGGLMRELKGVVNDDPALTDECEGTTDVREWYCDENGLPQDMSLACDNGCVDGACLVAAQLECNSVYQDEDQFYIGETLWQYKGADNRFKTDGMVKFKNWNTGETLDQRFWSYSDFSNFSIAISPGVFPFEAFMNASPTDVDDWAIMYTTCN
ncbi:hypothetical protein HOL21_03450 [Candidatus Woesearchaeota archaeon]|nr:hypothetical protein [Candidatus Woesearchaeota archaeon]MBT5397242.1 hypothetical protein [Candidatus Woesearchaeota archaeon]MBT6367212.1 hypothetical protein [Candidatus Woesearchaeota archaeon]MBT7762642.1 hypothetical protein [Candidatus Woesearchaeota archaeon]